MQALTSILKHCCAFSQPQDEDTPHSPEPKATGTLQAADSSLLFTFAGPSASSLFSFAPVTDPPIAGNIVDLPAEGKTKYRRSFNAHNKQVVVTRE